MRSRSLARVLASRREEASTQLMPSVVLLSNSRLRARRSVFVLCSPHALSFFLPFSRPLALLLSRAPTHPRVSATLSQQRGWLSLPRSRASQSRREPASLRGDLSSTSAKVSPPRRVLISEFVVGCSRERTAIRVARIQSSARELTRTATTTFIEDHALMVERVSCGHSTFLLLGGSRRYSRLHRKSSSVICECCEEHRET